MTNSEETKKCPYCSEEILVSAKKCKHCGEWLVDSEKRKGTSWGEKGSVDARSVSRGLKQKELDDFSQGCFGLAALIFAIILGVFVSRTFNSPGVGWIVGIAVFIIAMIYIAKWYYQE